MHPTAAKKSRGNSVWFLFNSEEVKNQTHSFTLGHCLGFAPPCSSLCFLLRASPALCALIGPSPPPSLAYLAFLQGLGSAGAFHSHQSRLFPLEKAKFLFCRTKCNAVWVLLPFAKAFLPSCWTRSHNLIHFNFYGRHNPQVCPKSYLSGISGFLWRFSLSSDTHPQSGGAGLPPCSMSTLLSLFSPPEQTTVQQTPQNLLYPGSLQTSSQWNCWTQELRLLSLSYQHSSPPCRRRRW